MLRGVLFVILVASLAPTAEATLVENVVRQAETIASCNLNTDECNLPPADPQPILDAIEDALRTPQVAIP